MSYSSQIFRSRVEEAEEEVAAEEEEEEDEADGGDDVDSKASFNFCNSASSLRTNLTLLNNRELCCLFCSKSRR